MTTSRPKTYTEQEILNRVFDAPNNGLRLNQYDALFNVRTGDGYFFGAGVVIGTTPALGADTLYGIPIYVPRTMTFDRIAIHVTTGAVSSNIRLGIHKLGTNLYPGVLVLDAGEVDSATTGVKTITISQQLAKGLYFVALVSNGTPSVAGASPTSFGAVFGLIATDFANYNNRWAVAFTYAALPDPFTAGGTLQNANVPIIGLRPLSMD